MPAANKSDRYSFKEAESYWQTAWENRECFATDDDSSRPKHYVPEMFLHPSGRIHMGHANYTMGDVVARYKRARGFNVLHPMGWDVFGMPAENAAMEKVHPAEWTYANIDTMRHQLKMMGCQPTGRAKSRPVIRIITGTNNRCFWIFWRPV